MKQIIDLTGKKFGRLTVLNQNGRSNTGKVRWDCICECGKERIVIGTDLKTGNTLSCGCYHKHMASMSSTRHGLRSHPLYKVWVNMVSRCYNPNATRFDDYGGRGIMICDRWRNSFKLFHDDMITGYNKLLRIDRIDNNKGYCKENCRWVTTKENNRNSRSSNAIFYKGETRCISEWCEILGLKYHTVLYRINRGWSMDDILNTNKQ